MTRRAGLLWWIDRWRASSAYTDLTLEEQAAYRNLLDEGALRGGPIPNDDHILAKACGDPRRWPKLKPKVLARFQLTAEGWRNATLEEVLRKGMAVRQARSEAGKNGAVHRWHKR
jgi:uncharacterized protein YdaU (DUF1376 family)